MLRPLTKRNSITQMIFSFRISIVFFTLVLFALSNASCQLSVCSASGVCECIEQRSKEILIVFEERKKRNREKRSHKTYQWQWMATPLLMIATTFFPSWKINISKFLLIRNWNTRESERKRASRKKKTF